MISMRVSAPVVLDRRIALLSAWDAGADPFVFYRVSKPASVLSAISEQPVDIWYAVQ